MHTREPITTAISSVPSVADVAVLRRVRRMFALQPNPALLAIPRQQIRDIGLQPMGQPSILGARECPAFAMFDVLQIFNTQHTNIRPVNLLDGLSHSRLDFRVRVFLAFGEGAHNRYLTWVQVIKIDAAGASRAACDVS